MLRRDSGSESVDFNAVYLDSGDYYGQIMLIDDGQFKTQDFRPGQVVALSGKYVAAISGQLG